MLYLPLLINLMTTCYFIGLVWIIQLVQYPLFACVEQEQFPRFHAAHSQHIIYALGLPVLLAFGSCILLFWLHPPALPFWSIIVNLLLLVAVWAVTACIHVPLHRSLGQTYSLRTITLLIDTNWIRTAIWTLQGVLLLWMTVISLPAL